MKGGKVGSGTYDGQRLSIAKANSSAPRGPLMTSKGIEVKRAQPPNSHIQHSKLGASIRRKSAMADIDSIINTAKQYLLVEEQLLPPTLELCMDYLQVLALHKENLGIWGDICQFQRRHDLAKRYYEVVTSNY
jgi:hypothetical protein